MVEIALRQDRQSTDGEHRQHFLSDGKKNWQGFFKAAPDDPPLLPQLR